MKKVLTFLTSLLCIALISTTGYAHPGRTDASGGHKDNKNASGLGSYHYHHGYSAHLHPNGVCPYENTTPAITKITTSKPTSVKASVTPASITITWEPVANADIYEASLNGQIISTSETSVIYTGLNSNTSYEYAVRAHSVDGYSEYSETHTVSTLSAPEQKLKPIIVTVDGETIEFDQPPTVINGRVMVPIRNIVEKMNCNVTWEESTQTVYITEKNIFLNKTAIKSDTIKVYVNNILVGLSEQPPVNIEGRILLPVRPVVEKLGYTTQWNEDLRTVAINKNE
ncbi:stalk domain-containing protein [Anaeropeptidivorans aminofermentans]|uniref:stalk domain-containing protein n=1 Tax=Anaeropeptidivorans aminofermentans TaxID=2934315 RepID=UPI002ED40564